MGEVLPKAVAFRDVIDEGRGAGHRSSLLLTMAEAENHLRISRWTLKRLVDSGELRTIEIGRRRLVSRQSLQEFISRHEVPRRSTDGDS